jgi:hypothetical protein
MEYGRRGYVILIEIAFSTIIVWRDSGPFPKLSSHFLIQISAIVTLMEGQVVG